MNFIKKAAAVFFAFFIIFGVSAFPVFADVREQIPTASTGVVLSHINAIALCYHQECDDLYDEEYITENDNKIIYSGGVKKDTQVQKYYKCILHFWRNNIE